MTSPRSVEEWASRIPDSAKKLRYLRQANRRKAASKRTPRWQIAVAALLPLILLSPPARPRSAAAPPVRPVASPLPAPVFLAGHKPEGDLYSNGLEILSAFETTSTPRAYRGLDRATLKPRERSVEPAGIVFHTTESLVAPMEPDQAKVLSRARADVLDHVRRNRLYNFVISRFGEVFRVVPENQTACHAGHSVWADRSTVYIGLNESFLGVAFEMRAGQTATPAQRHAGRLLTDVLRARYHIADGNCVTHAQVSVNPDNLRIGFHTDWGSDFPFAEMGLTAGYGSHVAAVEIFGFNYDESFLAAVGGRPWTGLLAAEQRILLEAAAHGTLSPRYRTFLQQQYKSLRRRPYEKPD